MSTGGSEDVPEMAQVLDVKRENIKQINEEEQVHRAHMTALSQMQLQALQLEDEQEKELLRQSGLLMEYQAILHSLP